jgi:hypothetical protein
MNTPHQEIHLWPELLSLRAGSGSSGPGVEFKPLPLPFAPMKLTDLRESPQLVAPLAASAGGSVLLEPFFNPRHQLALLATFSPESAPRVNGQPSPGRVVLGLGDHFQWSPGIAFHVTIFNQPRVGPPSAAQIGRPCPVCRVPFTTESRCYACFCGTVLHCEDDEQRGLQCAQLRQECPRCRRPVRLEEGYAFTPEDD